MFRLILVFCFTVGALWAHPGHGIDFDSQGNLYFIDTVGLTIWRMDNNGHLEPFVENTWAHFLDIDSEDRLWFDAEPPSGGAVSIRFKENGRVHTVLPFTPRDLETSECRGAPLWFNNGLSLARDEDGNSYNIAYQKGEQQPRVVRRTGGTRDGMDQVLGKPLFRVTEEGVLPQALRVIEAMILDPNGDLLVSADGAIWRIKPSGEAIILLPRLPGTGSHDMQGICLDMDGSIFAVNAGHRAVYRIDPDGSYQRIYRAPFHLGVTGVTTRNGRVYILRFVREELTPLHRWIGGPDVIAGDQNGAWHVVTGIPGSKKPGILFIIVIVASGLWALLRSMRKKHRTV